jgi:hypothetical protein
VFSPLCWVIRFQGLAKVAGVRSRVVKLALVLATGALLLTPAQTQAAVTGDWGAYAAMASRFRMPLPVAYVHSSDCPDDGGACANPATGEAWVPRIDMDRFSLAHELGHLFDAQRLTDRDREWLRLTMRAPAGDWWKPWGAGEWFADYYADCAIYGGRPWRSSPETYLAERPPARRVARVCWAILAWGLTR